jgi:hypothetical protein
MSSIIDYGKEKWDQLKLNRIWALVIEKNQGLRTLKNTGVFVELVVSFNPLVKSRFRAKNSKITHFIFELSFFLH